MVRLCLPITGSRTGFGDPVQAPVLREAVGAQAVGSPLALTCSCCCQLLWLCGIHSSAHTARAGAVTGEDLQKKISLQTFADIHSYTWEPQSITSYFTLIMNFCPFINISQNKL